MTSSSSYQENIALLCASIPGMYFLRIDKKGKPGHTNKTLNEEFQQVKLGLIFTVYQFADKSSRLINSGLFEKINELIN